MIIRRASGFAALWILALVGCGADQIQATNPATMAPAASDSGGSGVDLSRKVPQVAGLAWNELHTVSDTADRQTERKIIYTASVDLVVTDISETKQRVDSLLEEAGGYVANYREDRSYGDRLRATWVLRIPVAKFNEFMQKVDDLGIPERREQDAQDVTDEFYDFTTRLNSKQLLKARLEELSKTHTGDLKDLLVVETELERVHSEIDRIEGHLKVLSDKTQDTTVTISAREQKNYKPPQAPGFGDRISITFYNSLSGMRAFFELIVLCAVAVFPWLVAPMLFVAVLIVVLRQRFRRAQA